MIYIFPSQIDLIWCPVRCVCVCVFFLSTLPPTLPHAYTHKHTLFLCLEGGFSDSSLISHVLVLKFSKGDRQLLFPASKAITTLPRGRLTFCHSPSQQKLQRDQKCILRCKIPNSHPDTATKYFITQTHEQIKYQMCSFLSLCLCNMMRWLSATSSWEHFYRNHNEKRKT